MAETLQQMQAQRPGCRVFRKSSAGYIALYDTSKVDGEYDKRWLNACEAHNTAAVFDKFRDALDVLNDVNAWCPECAKAEETKKAEIAPPKHEGDVVYVCPRCSARYESPIVLKEIQCGACTRSLSVKGIVNMERAL